MLVSLREQIAQMLCFGFSGSLFSEATELQNWLQNQDGLGWLIAFDYDLQNKSYPKNIVSLEQIKKLNHDIKKFYHIHHATKLPLKISVDVEGGKVDRLARCNGYQSSPSAFVMANMDSQQRAVIWQALAELLKDLGFDLNFAPVVDLNLSPGQGIFGPLQRCFSDKAHEVSQLAMEYINILKKNAIMACLKHFPGHGSASGDSHTGFVDVSASFQEQELIPYQQLITQPNLVAGIMTAHVINKHLDASGLPATLSKKILNGLLRDKLNYQGLIFSDDLQMHAIAKFFSRSEAIKLSIEAGADVIMFCNQLGNCEPGDIIDEVEELVQNKSLDKDLITRAYQRIAAYKLAYTHL